MKLMVKYFKLFGLCALFLLASGSLSAFPLGYHTSNPSKLAWDYVQRYDFYEIGGNSSYYQLGFNEVVSYTHTHPFSIPTPDSVTEAELTILVSAQRTDLSWASIEGTGQWDKLNNLWWFSWSATTWDLSGLNPSVWTDGLNVSVASLEPRNWFGFGEGIRLESSTLRMSTMAASAIPEPFTMSLFGLGLLGIGLVRRAKK